MPEFVEIVDVSPRDGLQSQPALVSTEDKLALINRLIDAGVRRMEVVSFVNPKRVPQMADAEQVVSGLPQRDDARFIGLVLNTRGFERAAACGIGEINCAVVASDAFNQRNQGATTEETMTVIEALTRQAQAAGMDMGVTISAAFGCPFEGEVPKERVARLAQRLAALATRKFPWRTP